MLEICVEGLANAMAAVNAGAQRLELNTVLQAGGLTASVALVRLLKQQTKVPLIAMVRPRAGGFDYSPDEFELMLAQADDLLKAGADGLIAGFLTTGYTINIQQAQAFAQRFKGAQLVFSRAFDLITNQADALEQLIELGYTRVLTSGGMATASQGCQQLAGLVKQARGRIEILPASGINSQNAEQLLAQTNANQLHASCSQLVGYTPAYQGPVSFGPAEFNKKVVVNQQSVAALRAILDKKIPANKSGY